LDNIRQLYKPVQPTVKQSAKQSAKNVTYMEFLPEPMLQKYIYCYWQLKTVKPLAEPFVYRVVADGCIDIFFELNQSHENFVMGFCKKFTEFSLNNSFHYIGVRFMPTMFPQLFGVNATELSNRFEQLSNVVPKVAAFIANNFHDELTISQIQLTFDHYFMHHLKNINIDIDHRLYSAIQKIMHAQGVLNIQKDIDSGVSQRQLRRLFEFYIGDSPKTFSKVVRFQNILNAKPSSQSLKQNKLFFDVGYYDQAHFIKEFKNFYGVTPSKAFGRA
jgi:AraC-like DNA-binding protein